LSNSIEVGGELVLNHHFLENVDAIIALSRDKWIYKVYSEFGEKLPEYSTIQHYFTFLGPKFGDLYELYKSGSNNKEENPNALLHTLSPYMNKHSGFPSTSLVKNYRFHLPKLNLWNWQIQGTISEIKLFKSMQDVHVIYTIPLHRFYMTIGYEIDKQHLEMPFWSAVLHHFQNYVLQNYENITIVFTCRDILYQVISRLRIEEILPDLGFSPTYRNILKHLVTPFIQLEHDNRIKNLFVVNTMNANDSSEILRSLKTSSNLNDYLDSIDTSYILDYKVSGQAITDHGSKLYKMGKLKDVEFRFARVE